MKSVCLRLAVCLSVATMVSSCESAARFTYPDKMNSLVVEAQSPLYGQRVAVVPFEDCRSDDNETSTMSLYYVPLAPFGFVECERPETGSRFPTVTSFNFNPTEDLAKAAAVSLKRSNLFQDAFFTYGGEKANADLVLEGRILSTYYKGRLLSYCVSIYSCYLWVLGAPSGTSLNRISLELTLKNKSGRILWTRSVLREDYIIQWIYARRGQDMKLYSALTRDALNEAVMDLSSRLRSDPSLLKP